MITQHSIPARDKRPAVAVAGKPGQLSRSCRCGQQLDVCANANCPRCGRKLAHY